MLDFVTTIYYMLNDATTAVEFRKKLSIIRLFKKQTADWYLTLEVCEHKFAVVGSGEEIEGLRGKSGCPDLGVVRSERL